MLTQMQRVTVNAIDLSSIPTRGEIEVMFFSVNAN